MRINGMEAALRQLQNLPEQANASIQKSIDETANKIVQDASSAAPGSIGGMISSQSGQLSALVSVSDAAGDYPGYVEMGTGVFAKRYVATLPQEWQDEAMKFFKTGKGKGHPYPYFYPAVMRNSPELMAEIEKELQKLAK